MTPNPSSHPSVHRHFVPVQPPFRPLPPTPRSHTRLTATSDAWHGNPYRHAPSLRYRGSKTARIPPPPSAPRSRPCNRAIAAGTQWTGRPTPFAEGRPLPLVLSLPKGLSKDLPPMPPKGRRPPSLRRHVKTAPQRLLPAMSSIFVRAPSSLPAMSSFLTTHPLPIMTTMPSPQIRPLANCHQMSSLVYRLLRRRPPPRRDGGGRFPPPRPSY